MRLPVSEHTSRPWRVHEVAPDFDVADVWALATPGGPDQLPHLVSQITSGDFPSANDPLLVRFLWGARWKIGRLLRWDDQRTRVGHRVASLRDRLPADLRSASTGPDIPEVSFKSVFLLDDEWAAEIANRTVHGIMHLGWVRDDNGGYRGQMAVLVKTNGKLGAAYMAAIKPLRHLFVYPALLRRIERDWRAGAPRNQTSE